MSNNPADTNPMNRVLLKDYRPQSSLVVKQTLVARPGFPVIDAHVHSPTRLSSELLDAWVRLMDRLEIEKCFVLTDCFGEEFRRQAEIYLAQHRARFVLFCSLDTADFAAPGYAERVVGELERCHLAGALGVGELTDKGWGLESGTQALQTEARQRLPRNQRLHLDDPRLEGVWQRCADLQLPVSMHIADHPSAWQPLGPKQERGPAFARFNLFGRDVPSYGELLGMRERLLGRHPGTTFIACHLGNQGNDLTALAASMDRFPNMYVDISARDYELGRQPRAARAFLQRFQHRVLFGTDYAISPQMYQWWFRFLQTADEYMLSPTSSWRLYGLALPKELLEALYSGNARNLIKDVDLAG